MGFRKKECRASPALARKVVRQWSLIFAFCKVSLLGTLRSATRSGARIFSSERLDVQPVTRSENEVSSSLGTWQGLHEIILRMRFATRFLGRAENSKRPRPWLDRMDAGSPA